MAAERVLSLHELNRATLARQLLLEQADMPVPAAIERLVGLQAQQAIAGDAFAAFTAALTAEAGITLDQSAINAVHASMP